MNAMIRTYQASNIARPVRHGFFTRQGGVSTGIYKGLNVGLGSSDQRPLVEENRRLALAYLCEGEGEGEGEIRLCTACQTHSAQVVVVEKPWPTGSAPQVDAMVTSKPGIALGILTADCAPVLLADAEAGVIGAAHAGWKGALGGIVEATLQAMETLGADRSRVSAAIGPAIAQQSYEVGPEFPAEFLQVDSAAKKYFANGRDGHFQFDLPGYVETALRRAGIESVWTAGLDTYEIEEDFFSYRRTCHRSETDYGRQLSAILLV